MDLDFTKLNSLAFMDFTEIPPEKQLSKTPLEPEQLTALIAKTQSGESITA